jgi:hypothetical protein
MSGYQEGPSKRIGGGVGARTDSILQKTNEGIQLGHEITDTGLAIQGLLTLAPTTGGRATVTTNIGRPFLATGNSTGAVAEETINLYRAVGPAELKDIRSTGGIFRIPLGNAEAKYFATTPGGAASFARQTYGTGLFQGPYTIVQTRIPTSTLNSTDFCTVDRGITTIVVRQNNLPFLDRASIFNFSPLPPILPQ